MVIFHNFNIVQKQKKPNQYYELKVDDMPWAWLVYDSYDPQNHDETYKPYIHLLSSLTHKPITKGIGGIDSHHRGIFMGWNKVHVGESVYDFWHMTGGVSQRHVEWITDESSDDATTKKQRIHWCDPQGIPLIDEIRTISAKYGPDTIRLFDISSELTSLAETIQLRGDLHHAGMHVRLANEVFWTQWRTRYFFPAGVFRKINAHVPNTWWVCCSAVVQGQRYHILHMTHPENHPVIPTYSARQYARFGSFFETVLKPDEPAVFRFRIALTHDAINVDMCEMLFKDYRDLNLSEVSR